MTVRIRLKHLVVDASAIVKIVSPEERGFENVQALINDIEASCLSTWLCVAEAFGALKKKLNEKVINSGEYTDRLFQLSFYVETPGESGAGGNPPIHLIDVPFREFDLFNEAERLVHHGNIDFSDALQFVALRHTALGLLVGESKARLVTSDRRMKAVAEAEGIETYDPETDDYPPWAVEG